MLKTLNINGISYPYGDVSITSNNIDEQNEITKYIKSLGYGTLAGKYNHKMIYFLSGCTARNEHGRYNDLKKYYIFDSLEEFKKYINKEGVNNSSFNEAYPIF